jgi:hypothetical protein
MGMMGRVTGPVDLFKRLSVAYDHVNLFRGGSESEHFRDSFDKIVLSHRGVDLNGWQFQTRRFLAEDVGEHPIALKQVTQGSFRIVVFARNPDADPPRLSITA